jgi:hypothetical protein
MILFNAVFPGIYLSRNITVTGGNKLSRTVDKICAECFSGPLGKESEKKTGKRKESESIPLYVCM